MTYAISNLRVVQTPSRRKDGRLLVATFDAELGPIGVSKMKLLNVPERGFRVVSPGLKPTPEHGGFWVPYAILNDLKRQVVPIVQAMIGEDRLTDMTETD